MKPFLLIVLFVISANAQQCWQGIVSSAQISLTPVPCVSPAPSPTPTPLPTPTPTPIPTSSNLAASYTAASWNGRLVDQSGNRNDAVPYDPSRAPIFSATAANGRPGLLSNGMTALVLSHSVQAQVAIFIVKHDSGQQLSSSLLSDWRSGAGSNAWAGAAYLHTSNLLDYEESPFLSSDAPELTGGTIQINSVSYPPLLAPKPRELSVVVFRVTAPLAVDVLLNHRFYPDAGWHGVFAEARLYSSISEAELTTLVSAKIAEYSIHSAPLVIFDGDSKTHGISDWWNCVDCAYPAKTAALLNVDYGNYGIGSETMAAMLAKFDAAIAPLLADRTRTRIVILQGGGNDIGANPINPEVAAHAVFNTALAYAAKVRAAGGKIIITTLTPSNPTYAPQIGFNFTAFESARQILNTLERGSPAFDGVIDRGADPTAGCPTCADNRAVFIDGVHETEVENRRWAIQAAEVAKRLLL